MPSEDSCSVMTKIKKVEEDISACEERADDLEKKLRYDEIPSSKITQVQTELEEVRKLLKTHKEQLKNLHKHNRSSFTFAMFLCFGFLALYMLSMLVWGRDI